MHENLQERLAAAADAYKRMCHAESEVSRLNSYSRLTAGMRVDRAEWTRKAREARAGLEAALRGADEPGTASVDRELGTAN